MDKAVASKLDGGMPAPKRMADKSALKVVDAKAITLTEINPGLEKKPAATNVYGAIDSAQEAVATENESEDTYASIESEAYARMQEKAVDAKAITISTIGQPRPAGVYTLSEAPGRAQEKVVDGKAITISAASQPAPGGAAQPPAGLKDFMPAALPSQGDPGRRAPAAFPGAVAVAGSWGNDASDAFTEDLEADDALEANQAEPEPQAQNSDGLAEARPVNEDEADPRISGEAQEIDLALMEAEKKKERRKQCMYMVGCLALFVAVVIAVTVGVTTNTISNKDTTSPESPSLSPTEAPTQVPSSAPTGSLDTFLESLPDYTLAGLQNSSSPQFQAFQWLSNHQDISLLPEWRKRQRFALATFYLSYAGEHWREAVRNDGWMDTARHECFWHSSRYGQFIGDVGNVSTYGQYADLYGASGYEEDEYMVCNEMGEFSVLGLYGLGLSGRWATIPSEIAMLSSLTVLALAYSNVGVDSSEFVSIEALQQLKNLTVIEFSSLSGTIHSEFGLLSSNLEFLFSCCGSLTGTIPSELGALTKLSWLQFSSNLLTGSIPNTLSLLTKLETLDFSSNLLTGLLPSDLGLLSNLTSLDFSFTGLSGSIPSELGRLSDSYVGLINTSLSGRLPVELCPRACTAELASPFLITTFLGKATNVKVDHCICDPSPEAFPVANSTNTVVINVKFDDFAHETSWALEAFDGFSANNYTWVPIASLNGSLFGSLEQISYSQQDLSSETLFHFSVADSWGDGKSLFNQNTP